ncbi:Thioredoxin [Mycoplasmopsis maculosa]|uniref:Thioredoxin n=1 Tax=Mycoplasmopsis maculosa TaxID=114885 RepID=A0A449B4B4_9BACT|nr:thioredoxin family protein [Mycoplasmopsis maculosa]VEU75416.1 Thioredoxin [Mycoplasmopsis maculosa]
MFQEINTDEFKQNVLPNNKGKFILVFHALWCPPCRQFKNPLTELAEKDGVQVYRINVDENPSLAAEYRVSSIPAWFIYNNGEVAYNGGGYLPYEEIKKVFDSVK